MKYCCNLFENHSFTKIRNDRKTKTRKKIQKRKVPRGAPRRRFAKYLIFKYL